MTSAHRETLGKQEAAPPSKAAGEQKDTDKSGSKISLNPRLSGDILVKNAVRDPDPCFFLVYSTRAVQGRPAFSLFDLGCRLCSISITVGFMLIFPRNPGYTIGWKD